MQPFVTFRNVTFRKQSPGIVGIVNLSADSFSDGGKLSDLGLAYDYCYQLLHDGADMLDIGAESTRPGAQSVSGPEQLKTLLPLLRRLGSFSIPISIDTSDPLVMLECLQTFPIAAVNDIRAGRLLIQNTHAQRTLSQEKIGYILTHAPVEPENMRTAISYSHVQNEVSAYLQQKIIEFTNYGFAKEQLCIDPGIGFSKSSRDNLLLLKDFSYLSHLNTPIYVGLSRKSFFDKIFHIKDPLQRDPLSAHSSVFVLQQGASMVRVHNVALCKQFLLMTQILTHFDGLA